ncbi:VRR-NUC domain-containing protein [Burkholderia cenocepacia]|uniref:VRR-NUC domain-containing protein n=1 Tax=Burkholderia cenocepacia TaxID=95486 RepID=UPI000CFED4F8|nr:hypothetical protein C6T64_32860 [Burkholderia cenocepacia]
MRPCGCGHRAENCGVNRRPSAAQAENFWRFGDICLIHPGSLTGQGSEYLQKWPSKGKKYDKGDVRRPDVVIVNDPAQPPVQSNIKTVVEMKFPGDTYGPDQEDDYIEIAGGPSKFVHLGAADCGCGDDDGQKKTSRSRQTASQSDLDELYGTSPSAPGAPPLPPPQLQPFPAL